MTDPNGNAGARIVYTQRRTDGTLARRELHSLTDERETMKRKGIQNGPPPDDPIDPDSGGLLRNLIGLAVLAIFFAITTAGTPARAVDHAAPLQHATIAHATPAPAPAAPSFLARLYAGYCDLFPEDAVCRDDRPCPKPPIDTCNGNGQPCPAQPMGSATLQGGKGAVLDDGVPF